MKVARTPSGGTSEDVDAMTFHIAKITAGAIDPAWTTANYVTCEGKFDTWWTAFISWYATNTALNEYRWFKDGPAFAPADRADGPPNPAERVTLKNVAGSNGAANMLPPQVAATCTEITSERKRWGRFYMPAWSAAFTDPTGRIPSAFVTGLLGPTVTLYNGLRAAGFRPVVFSRERSAHAAKGGGTIAFHPATAYEVTSLQVDNVWDVLRSRRFDGPTQRARTALT